MPPIRQKATLVRARALSQSVRSLAFRPEQGPLAFSAGQWINVYVGQEGAQEKRAYSIASGPNDSEIELAVTHVVGGTVSPQLHALEIGATVSIDGPHGLFTRSEHERAEPSLFVATGTGLAPFRSMLRDELKGEGASIKLLFGCRTQADILWRDELDAWSRDHPRFSYEVTLSRPEGEWHGKTGHVQTHLVELARSLFAPRVYACGLSRMTSDVRRLLKDELGYDRRRIHTERYD